MNLNAALQLVRQKYLDETAGVTTGETAERYREAVEQFPAVMAVAHQLWAREMMKGLA